MSTLMPFLLLFIAFHALCVSCVPFVTKRVSLHNPISIDFSGWVPLKRPLITNTNTNDDDVMIAQSSEQNIQQDPPSNTPSKDTRPSMDDHFLTVPVAVETDAEHVLSEADLNQIRDHVITNWKQQPIRSESFPHIQPLVQQLLPKPEVELEKRPVVEGEASEDEYTFVKMSSSGDISDRKSNSTEDENLFHAYFAPRDHVPASGYVRLTKEEFRRLFRNAEILFV